jgi:thioredoxin reductase/CRP-like cAMP-binding protein/Pyruvate/2-oxoacid:ferredoxin oxidoreductase delta subunit
MSDTYRIVIVGAGPGGLSAAAHAAESGISHVLLEGSARIAKTIQRYQKGKHVMAEPSMLPLRSPIPFDAGSRESILDAWDQGVADHRVNIAYDTEVVRIEGEKGNFRLTSRDGREFVGEHIILGIGVQGNPRTLGVDGEDLPFVQYQLDDPDEYRDETIVVVGAGDAAIENAMALSEHNKVSIINRRDEFSRAKEGNLKQITSAIESNRIQGFYNTTVKRVDAEGQAGKPGQIVLNSPEGEVPIAVDRVIARLGAIPPRKFVESCGIRFPSESVNAVPELSHQYESNVPGLYIVGALAGYPLIKQAMNQGYEVVEYIEGNPIKPVDHDIFVKKFNGLPYEMDVDETLDYFQRMVPFFGPVNTLRFRELMLESNVLQPQPGEMIFARNDYTNTFFTIVEGSVEVVIDEATDTRITVAAGQFFGEMSLISGRRRSATVYARRGCVLIETPRRVMNNLINSVDEVKRRIDQVFILRAIHSQFAPTSKVEDLAELVTSAELRSYDPGEVLFAEGESGDELHLIRRGSVTVSRYVNGREVVLSYVPAGKYVGEMGLLGNTRRSASVRAAVPTETVVMKSKPFLKLLDKDPLLREKVQANVQQRLNTNVRMEQGAESGELMSFLMRQGLGEATDVLLIDESLCVRCDNCEDACAATHGGTSRLNREAGPTFAQVHVPTSCRHCEHPHCMKDCPPDAISRNANGEVVIDDSCIGCGNCEENCPYDVIQMAHVGDKQPSLISQLLFGSKRKKNTDPDQRKQAVKCDMCSDLDGGPACVRACPTGAAIRTSPEHFVDLMKTE